MARKVSSLARSGGGGGVVVVVVDVGSEWPAAARHVHCRDSSTAKAITLMLCSSLLDSCPFHAFDPHPELERERSGNARRGGQPVVANIPEPFTKKARLW